MDNNPAVLRAQLAPIDFLVQLAAPLGTFLNQVGTAPLLCVSLDGGTHELESGLLGSMDGEQGGVRTLGFHTTMADPSAASLGSPRGFDAGALATRLGSSRHFVLPLAKRSAETISMERISVGRARNKDVVLRDASVSKFHAWFEFGNGGEVMLADAGSKNGTVVAGERLAPRSLVEVPFGAAITFGSVRVFVCDATVLWEASRQLSA